MANVVGVTGLRELGERLKALPKELASKNGGPLRVALAKIAREVAKEAKSRVAVDTGAVKDNIITWRDRDPRKRGMTEAYSVTVRSKTSKKVVTKTYKDNRSNRRLDRVGKQYQDYERLYYAKLLEFGTSKMTAKPFLTPAFEAVKARMPEMFRDELGKGIDRAVKKLAKQKT